MQSVLYMGRSLMESAYVTLHGGEVCVMNQDVMVLAHPVPEGENAMLPLKSAHV